MLTTQKIQIYYYFEFPTRHPYKICWFEFWVRRPKRLAPVTATAVRFRGVGGRGGGDHGGEGRGGGGLCGGGVATAGSAGAAAAATAAGVSKIIKSNAPSLQQVSTKKRENEKKQTRF